MVTPTHFESVILDASQLSCLFSICGVASYVDGIGTDHITSSACTCIGIPQADKQADIPNAGEVPGDLFLCSISINTECLNKTLLIC